jgi:hypothetical protein
VTLKEILEACIKMWAWLAEHPSCSKLDYFDAFPVAVKPPNECYLCQCTLGAGLPCSDCAITWTTTRLNYCLALDSPYRVWDTSGITHAQRTAAALEIVARAKAALASLTDNDEGEA